MKGQQLVKEMLKNKKVVMISKTYCPFCTKAKDALANYKIDPDQYEILEIENRDDMDEIQTYMKEVTGARSVPRVFISGSCIGGGDETMSLHRNKKLGGLLEKAGALK